MSMHSVKLVENYIIKYHLLPTRKQNVKKKTFMIKGDAWVNSELACFLSVLFTPLGDMISLMKYSLSRQLYFSCIFHLGVALDTEIWGS